MNAKKIVLLAAAGMMLASCGTSLTRADAIAEMDKIFAANTEATKVTYKYEAPAVGNATGAHGYTLETYDIENLFAYMTQEATLDVADEEAGIPAGTTIKEENWIYLKEETCYIATSVSITGQEDVKVYASLAKPADTDVIAKATYDAMVAAGTAMISESVLEQLAAGKSAANKNNPYGFCGFLNRFPEGDAIFTEGTGTLNTAKIIGESYTKFGEGSLKATYNAKYEGQEDEVYSAEWKENRIVALSNAKTSSASGYGFKTWKWDSEVSYQYPDFAAQGFTSIDFSEIINALF